MQEALGKVHPQFEQTDWLPGAVLATLLVTAGWGLLVCDRLDRHDLADVRHRQPAAGVIALALVTTLLVNTGRARYAPVTLLPMLFVTATTMTAAGEMIPQFMELVSIKRWSLLKGVLNIGMTAFVTACVLTLLLIAAGRWIAVIRSPRPLPKEGAA